MIWSTKKVRRPPDFFLLLEFGEFGNKCIRYREIRYMVYGMVGCLECANRVSACINAVDALQKKVLKVEVLVMWLIGKQGNMV